jgi:glutamate-1-semialdehyde 2,1-aminomutase
MAAGIATLRELRDHPPYLQLEHLGQRLEDGLRDIATNTGIAHQLARVGSMWTLFFCENEVVDYDAAKKCDTARFAKFFWAMMDRGVYLPCSQFEAAFISAAHTEHDIDVTLHAAKEALSM